MAAVALSPAQVLKLCKKVNDRFGLEDDPKKKGGDKERVLAKQNEEVATGLTALRNVARGGLENEGQVNRFQRVQRKAVPTRRGRRASRACKRSWAISTRG